MDVVVPVSPKDTPVLGLCVDALLRHLRPPPRRVILLSKERPPLERDDVRVQWVAEARLPVSVAQVGAELEHVGVHPARAGWYFQQLLKLQARHAVADLSDAYLVVDADVVLLAPLTVLSPDGEVGFYPLGDDYHPPYFEHMRLLTGGLVSRCQQHISGMCHLMLFHQVVLDSLISLAEASVQLPFWRAFVRCVAPAEGHMGASEYELYFNYALRWHPERVCMQQQIRWKNAPSTHVAPHADAAAGFTFVAYHTQLDDVGRRRTDAAGTPDEQWSGQGFAAEATRAARLR